MITFLIRWWNWRKKNPRICPLCKTCHSYEVASGENYKGEKWTAQ